MWRPSSSPLSFSLFGACHRIAYFSTHQEMLPFKLFVCHQCHFAPCCNPLHLALGTPGDNGHDRRKGFAAIVTLPNKKKLSRQIAYREQYIRVEAMSPTPRISALARRFLFLKAGRSYASLAQEIPLNVSYLRAFAEHSVWWKNTTEQQAQAVLIDDWCTKEEARNATTV